MRDAALLLSTMCPFASNTAIPTGMVSISVAMRWRCGTCGVMSDWTWR